MQFRLIAVGTKMPDWVSAGFADYAKRMPAAYALSLHEIPAEKRTKNSDIQSIIEKESEKLIAFSKPHHTRVALEVTGQTWSTEKLAKQLQNWHDENQTVDIFIGGPDGISQMCLQQCHFKLSLSTLTLPHPLVRIIIAEQLYRAWSILHNHPYHRA